MKKPQGMFVTVYRPADNYSCTQGPSATADTVLLVGEGIPELFESHGEPVMKLVCRTIRGNEYRHVEPIEPRLKPRMFGGNFVHSCDSRFPNDYPLPIHDREE